MSKYWNQRPKPKVEGPHPIWRGIGCLTILIAPLMAFAAAASTVQIASDLHWPMPYQLTGYPTIPTDLWKVGALTPIWTFIQSQNNLYAILALTVIYIIILYGVISVGYAIVYRFVGPSRFSPMDAPPPNIKVKRYKR
jgi:hypothetical protein